MPPKAGHTTVRVFFKACSMVHGNKNIDTVLILQKHNLVIQAWIWMKSSIRACYSTSAECVVVGLPSTGKYLNIPSQHTPLTSLPYSEFI